MSSLKTLLSTPSWTPFRNLWYGLTVPRLDHVSPKASGAPWARQLAQLLAETADTTRFSYTKFPEISRAQTALCPQNPIPLHDDEIPVQNRYLTEALLPLPASPRTLTEQHNSAPMENPFYRLYEIPRTGWTRVIPEFRENGLKRSSVENVAEHSFKTSILAQSVAHAVMPSLSEAQKRRLYLMALIHDHAEYIVGDLTPGQVTSRQQKHELEKKAYERMLSEAENDGIIQEKQRVLLSSLFDECLQNATLESKIVHFADKLDMALQAYVYEVIFHTDLHEFFESAARDLNETEFFLP